MPHATAPSAEPKKQVKKLVLCFDGTGNTFQGNTSDTNIVKIYDKLDRDNDNQYHYYQPGIGTYDIDGGSLNKGLIGNLSSKVSRTLDQGLATSFDAHVIAGYKFLMRYYDSGDKIYMFGFSRGAFTARFLARMINTIGLLSKGNDEMVPFAYELYQQYEQAKEGLDFGAHGPEHKHDHEAELVDAGCKDATNKLNAFTRTFCRRDKTQNADHTAYSGVKIYFLGIFDCVSSVAVLDAPWGRTPKPVSVIGTAEHVRHAVAADEFRVKFKAALLNQDVFPEKFREDEDIKEVWFPGNHGDVGGGWPAPRKDDPDPSLKKSFWARMQKFWQSRWDRRPSEGASFDSYQMSDIPLSWMIRELEMLGDQEPQYALKWSNRLDDFKKYFKHEQALKADRHNTMAIGRGSSFFKVLMWNIMDYLPFSRWELEKTGWKQRSWWPNMKSARDMPGSVLLHASLIWRLRNIDTYRPKNNNGDGTKPCLEPDFKYLLADDAKERQHKDVVHEIYALDQATVDNYQKNTAKVIAATGVALESPVVVEQPIAGEISYTVQPVVSPDVKVPAKVQVGVTEIFA